MSESSSYELLLAVSTDGQRWDLLPTLALESSTQSIRLMDNRLWLYGQRGKLLRGGLIHPGQDDHGSVQSAATLLLLNTPAAGNIEAPDDSDLFVLDLAAPGTLAVWTTGLLDTVGELHSASGLIARVDNRAGDRNLRIERAVLPGRFWVKVDSYSTATGNYLLHSSFVAAGPPFAIKRFGAAGDTGWQLTVATAIGYRYQVQHTIDLASGDWSALGDTVTATDEETIFTVPVSTEARHFFRIAVQAP